MKKLFAMLLVALSFSAQAAVETYFDHCLGDYVTYEMTTSSEDVSYVESHLYCVPDVYGNCAE